MEAARIFGYTTQEMLGQPIARIIPFDFRDEEREVLAKLRLGERIDTFDTIRLAKNGRRIPVSVTMSFLRDAAANVVGVSMIARDISERKQIEEALRTANEAAPKHNSSPS
jgi:two-component system, sensor histidine kinase and response regulator